MRDRDNAVGLFTRIESYEEHRFAARFRFDGGVDRFRFSGDLLPRANPGFVEIGGFVARILKNDRATFRSVCGRAKEVPERPVRAVETGEKQRAEAPLTSLCPIERRAISFRGERESGGSAMLTKPAHYRLKSREIDVVERDTSRAEALEQIEKMVRRALNRDRGEPLRVRELIVG